MSIHSWSLQKAIYTELNGNVTGIGGDVVPVYDAVPEDVSYPYIQIGEETVIDGAVKDRDGHEHTLTIHAWSQYRGRREIKALMERTYDLLHDAGINLDTGTLVNVRQEFSTTLAENDGLTRHGVMRFRAVVFDS